MAARARSTVIVNLAKEKNIPLLDDVAIRALIAKSVGVEENLIAYKEISLRDAQKKIGKTFQPIYKVSCMANNVKYKLRIDATNGNILSIKVG